MTQMFCGAHLPPIRGWPNIALGSQQETRRNTAHWNICSGVNGDGGDMVRVHKDQTFV